MYEQKFEEVLLSEKGFGVETDSVPMYTKEKKNSFAMN